MDLKPELVPQCLVRDAALRDTRLTGLSKQPADTRSEARRDRDRILYSVAWRRLGGVTQVITPFEDIALMHNRLTHSQKVAQVAKSIAQRLLAEESAWGLIHELGGIDADVVETAALAHDLGHPPFGHVGEITLDKIARRNETSPPDGFPGLQLADGFEGNAQTFRVVLLNETRNPLYDGLDLTCASLTAIAKYPWLRAPTLREDHDSHLANNPEYRRTWRKFSVYRSEQEAFQAARRFLVESGRGSDFPAKTQSLEASIMDAADDITYAIHDLEDFYLAGMLDVRAVKEGLSSGGDASGLLRELRGRLELDYQGYYDKALFQAAAKTVRKDLFNSFSTNYTGVLEDVGKARAAGSKLIGRYINSVTIEPDLIWPHGPFVALRRPEWHEVQVLKEVTRRFVITRPDIALLQRGQQKILRSLVRYLYEWKQSTSDFKRLPRRLRQEIETARRQQDGGCADGYRSGNGTQRAYAPRGEENRCILDYICTLTDGQACALYYKLSGAKPSTSAMDFFS
ncbi:dNTP triphosphohydrolase [Crossiella sp. CA-258035]|uniref:deoxyguanosinetriphosphate triphosphohydrolase family protein n=1 Tax=Crossiella sp. CA-258035 TaxID=2981138 RepID=UPI0024BCD144|nr:dNTP triphosphohydrolase [Crossiella sp. CA-258035]WHT21865.1 dNTP triphosphohydrolase [Crossiella sp. CA-258035]